MSPCGIMDLSLPLTPQSTILPFSDHYHLYIIMIGLAFGPTNSPPLESNTEKEDISSTREGQTLWSFVCGVELVTKIDSHIT